jgi:hypothetical protein
VGRGAAGSVFWVLLLTALPAAAQSQAPSEKLDISAKAAFTWSRGGSDVVLLRGPVSVTLDRVTLSADDAVVWLTPIPNAPNGAERAEFELIGHSVVKQTDLATAIGPERYFTAPVLPGGIKISAPQRVARDMAGDPLFGKAEKSRRDASNRLAGATGASPSTRRAGPTSQVAGRPTSRPAPGLPVQSLHVEAGESDVADTQEGTVALVFWNGVGIFAKQASGDVIELRAQRAVLFTSMVSLHDATKSEKSAEAKTKVTAVYLEGDAQIEYDPVKPGVGEQQLLAKRIYYDFTTDRAILVDAVLHTLDPKQNVPFIVRAKVLRQLSKAEFRANNVEITSSAFTVPSYSLAADRLYVRQEASENAQYPNVIGFEAQNTTLQAFHYPFFFLPYAAGTVGGPSVLRGIGLGDRSDLGVAAETEWGLFETLGQTPPRDLDANYRVDYFSKRGPALGLNAAYGGGFLTEPEHDPWNFEGDLKSYFVDDKGTDYNLGRLPVKPDGTGYVPRGRVLYEHQHFFPDDWQAQVRLGYVSDATFLQEWFPMEFYQGLPTNESAYIKQQRDTQAFTLLAEAQPNKMVTTSDRVAEQFEVERLPEVGYHRIGDAFAGNKLTFFSDNTAGGYVFQPSRATLVQQGFAPPNLNPGLPALGLTGITTNPTWRADSREEVDMPLNAGPLKIVPYGVGRFTEYSNSPDGGQEQHRFFGALGTRFTTAFWKTDSSAESDLFDIHQLRHVIEPEANLFTSGTSVDRSRLYQYDIPVDSVNDVSVAEVGLRQRWQTQRGGPGRWRSVDVFTLDVDAEFYANKPARKFLQPYDFRGIFYSSLPETSIPRDAVNADASWRLADDTVVLADAQYNMDEHKLATAAVGILVRRDPVQSWYIGNRYIADLNSNIVSVAANYQISPKYSLGISQAWDFGLGKDVSSNLSVVRSFDRFILAFNFSHDQITGQTGFGVSFAPLGFGQTMGTSALQGPFQQQQRY